MRRLAENDLKTWYYRKDRRPLILRGARQVGKSTLVRLFSQKEHLELLEINLEKIKIKAAESPNFRIQDLLDEIQLQTGQRISNRTLLFLDEVQEQPILLKWLRYFYEEKPELAVIAAGSLLEIALRTEQFSFPVGRVEFYHLGPMTFQEFLWATGNELLQEKIEKLEFSEAVMAIGKEQLRNYFYVGGMPKAVSTFIEEKSLVPVRAIQNQLIQAYVADFPKYNSRIQADRIQRIFSASALQLGKKLIYQRFDPDSQSRDIKRILELLIDARVLLPCLHSDANHIPLAGESDPAVQKLYFIDVGLMNSLLRVDLELIDHEMENRFSTKGILAEQFVAQHLAFIDGNTLPPSLHYWLRDKGSQKGELDFLIQKGQKIIPIEVKAAKGGHLKSLFYFAKEKGTTTVIKTSLASWSRKKIQHKIDGRTIEADLIELPLFAIEAVLNAI